MLKRAVFPSASENDSVPTTPENVYKNGGGGNMSLSQTEQRVERDFSPRKIEATDDDIQTCLKELLPDGRIIE